MKILRRLLAVVVFFICALMVMVLTVPAFIILFAVAILLWVFLNKNCEDVLYSIFEKLFSFPQFLFDKIAGE